MCEPIAAKCYHIPEALAGQRVDRALAELVPELTRSAAQRLLKTGLVKLDGVAAKASEKVQAGQMMAVAPGPPRPLSLTPEAIALDIVYEDADLLVVNKPPDMVVHPARGHRSGTLVNALLAHCRLSSGGEEFRPGIVHRLDRYTSGLLLVAKTDEAHALLSHEVEAHRVKRTYHALVWGHPSPPGGTISTGFSRHPQHRTMMTVRETGQGRRAVTHYRVLRTYCWRWQEEGAKRPRRREAALVECQLETGRTHQIRVHLQYLGYPLLGDPLYGDAVRDQAEPDELAALIATLPGQALHAVRLVFRHPHSGEEIALAAREPASLSALREWLAGHAVCDG